MDEKRGSVIVVDDDVGVLRRLDRLLRFEGYGEVIMCERADDAWPALRSSRPVAMILDLMMPGVDGFEVCTRLKRDIATQHTEVIAITGYYTEANMERILQAGAIACLKKPLDVAEVRRRVLESFNLKDERDDDDGDEADDAAPRVLLVTQNAGFRSSVKEELASGKTAIELMTAQTGADALLVAQAAPPRYVIVSLGVPDVKHSRVIEKLAGGKLSPTIIAVHDHPTDELRADARAAGARMCLPTVAVTGSVRELLGV